MPTQNVNLTQQQADFIRRSVESGDYNSASEVVRDALRVLKVQKDEYQAKLEFLRGELQKGLADIENGRVTDLTGREEIAAFGRQVSSRGRKRLGERNDGTSASAE